MKKPRPNLLRDVSEVFAGDDDEKTFLGDRFWWENFYDINTSKLNVRKSREFVNVKWILCEVVFYIFWTGIFATLSYVIVDFATCRELREFHQQFWNMDANTRMSSSDEFYSWANSVLVERSLCGEPGLPSMITINSAITTSFSSNNFTISSSPSVVPGTDMLLLGTIRLRQVRINYKDCSSSSEQYGQVATFCQSDYSARGNAASSDYYEITEPLYLKSAFTYTSHFPTTWIHSNQTELTYGPQGYSVDLPQSCAQSKAILADLLESDWIDFLTSAVVVEVNTYHPEGDIFVVDRFLFEFPSSGAITQNYWCFPVFGGLLLFDPSIYPLRTVLDGLSLIFAIVFTKWTISRCWDLRSRFLLWYISYIDIAVILTYGLYAILRIVVYIKMSVSVVSSKTSSYSTSGSTMSSLSFPNPYAFWPFSELISLEIALINLQATLMVLAFARVVKLCYLSRNLKLFVNLLSNGTSLWNVIGIIVITSITVVGLGFGTSVVAGDEIGEFSFVAKSIATNFANAFSVIWVLPQWIQYPWELTAMLLVFLVLMYIVIVPLFISVAVDAATIEFKRSQELVNDDTVLCENPMWIVAKLYMKSWVHWRERRDGNYENQAKADHSEPGIEISLLPGVVQKKVIQRRRELVKKLYEQIGYMNESFNEFSDFVSRRELLKLMQSNEFLCKVLRTDDVDEVIQRYTDDQDQTDLDIDDSVKDVAEELNELISSTNHRVQSDLERFKSAVQRLAKTTNLYKQNKRKPFSIPSNPS